MGNPAIWVWLGIFILLVIIELITVQLTTIWFAVGALASLILAAFGVDNIFIQVIVFLLVSTISLIATRPLVKKFINRKAVPTNSDRCIGKKAVVTEEINNVMATGAVRINGVEWTARSEKDIIIPVDTKVTIKRIDGVKVYVE